MANENETVERVCEVVKRLAKGSERCVSDSDLHPAVRRLHEKAAKNAVEFAERVEAAHKSELAANDAEIARLKRENFDLNGCLLAEKELVEKRDALIRSLADALNSYLAGECIDCGAKCEGDGACVHQKQLRALVKKSREVAK